MEIEKLKEKYDFSDGLMSKIEHSIDVLRKGEEFALRFYDKGYYLAFSGGKDSQALYHVAKLAGVKFEAHMNMTTVDPANIVSFVKKNYPDVIRHVPDSLYGKRNVSHQKLKDIVVRYLKKEEEEVR